MVFVKLVLLKEFNPKANGGGPNGPTFKFARGKIVFIFNTKKKYLQKNILSMKSTTFEQTMKKLFCHLKGWFT